MQPVFSSSISLRQIAALPSLYQAWRKVRANRGAAGIDAISIQEFQRYLEANLAELSRNLLNKTYEPLPTRQVHIPKANGKERELAIPTVRDRIAQRAVLDCLEPLFEPTFLDCSFAFRPNRSVAMAIQQMVVARAQGWRWIVDSDIENFFPAIDHRLLLEDLSRRVTDEETLDLITKWLDAGVLETQEPTQTWLDSVRASLSGAQLAVRDGVEGLLNDFVADKLGGIGDHSTYRELPEAEFDGDNALAPARSPTRRAVVRRLVQDGVLLAIAERAALKSAMAAKVLGIGGAALALAALTPAAVRAARKLIERKTGAAQGSPISPLLANIYLHPFDMAMNQQGLKLIRYCDDFVILCRNEAEARQTLTLAEAFLKTRRLRLNQDKTRLLTPGDEFDFLGYQFTANGRVIAPPSTTDTLAQEVVKLAERSMKRAAGEIASTSQKAKSGFASLKEKWLKRD